MIKVLVVEDSPSIREFLTHVLNSDPHLQVIATANDGEQAIEALKRQRPDVITMDIQMPGMNGFQVTRKIMETQPLPIVIVSGSVNVKEVEVTFKALDAGALAVVQRPNGIGHPDHDKTAAELIGTVKLMSEVKVVRRWPRRENHPQASLSARAASPVPEIDRTGAEIRLVAIGASTGGPIVIRDILAELPEDFPAPILIVQHMSPGFIGAFAEWLDLSCKLSVRIAERNEQPLAGHVYIAPDGVHMGIGSNGRIMLSQDEPENGLRPSVSFLFRSVAMNFGLNAVGVLLTGMGKDGAEELKLMREKGAVTIAQDQETSVVHGMPGEAIKLDGAGYVLASNKISAALLTMIDQVNRKAEQMRLTIAD